MKALVFCLAQTLEGNGLWYSDIETIQREYWRVITHQHRETHIRHPVVTMLGPRGVTTIVMVSLLTWELGQGLRQTCHQPIVTRGEKKHAIRRGASSKSYVWQVIYSVNNTLCLQFDFECIKFVKIYTQKLDVNAFYISISLI